MHVSFKFELNCSLKTKFSNQQNNHCERKKNEWILDVNETIREQKKRIFVENLVLEYKRKRKKKE